MVYVSAGLSDLIVNSRDSAKYQSYAGMCMY